LAREARPFFAFWTPDFAENLQTPWKMKVLAREARLFSRFGPPIWLKTLKNLRKMKVWQRVHETAWKISETLIKP